MLSVGTFTSRFSIPGMPTECADVGTADATLDCWAEAPLAAGRHELTAQAFDMCPTADSCECQGLTTGVCPTAARIPLADQYAPIQGGITATTTLELPAESVRLTF